MNILAIGAHPDDLDVCCGGTVALLSQRGERVVMCVATDGQARPVGDPERVSADLIGAELVWLGLPDGGLVDEFYGLQCWCRYAEAFRWWKAADRLVTRRRLP